MADTPAPNSDKPEVNRDDKGNVLGDLYGNKPPEAAPHTLGGDSEGGMKYHIHPDPNKPAPKYGIDSNGEAVGETKESTYTSSKLQLQVDYLKQLERPFMVSGTGATYVFGKEVKEEDISKFERLVSPLLVTDSKERMYMVGFDRDDLNIIASKKKIFENFKSTSDTIDALLDALTPDSVRSPDPSELIADEIRKFASKAPYRQGFGRIKRPLESGEIDPRLKAQADKDSIGNVMTRPNKTNEQFVEIVVGPRILFGALAVLGLYAAYKFGKKAPR